MCVQENAALKQELQTALGKLAVYEAGAGVAGIKVRRLASVSRHLYGVDLITFLLLRSPRQRRWTASTARMTSRQSVKYSSSVHLRVPLHHRI
jgi:hypothetical protein